MVQTIICRSSQEREADSGLGPGGIRTGCGFLLSLLQLRFSLGALYQRVVRLQPWQGDKTQTGDCLVCGFWLLGSGFGDVIHLPRSRHTRMQIIVKINPWRLNVFNCNECGGSKALFLFKYFSIMIFEIPLWNSVPSCKIIRWVDLIYVRINIYKFQSQCCCLEWSKI